LAVVALLMAVACWGVPWWLEWARVRFPKAAYLHQSIDVGWGPAALGTVCLLGAAVIAWTVVRKRPIATLAAVSGTTVAAAIVLLTAVAPVAAGVMQAPLRDVAIRASREAGPDGGVAVYGLNKPSVVFYAKRLVTVIGEGRPEEAAALLRQDRAWFVITKAVWLDRLGPVYAVESRGGYVLASNRPPVASSSSQEGGSHDVSD
jgi:hypothetical protein